MTRSGRGGRARAVLLLLLAGLIPLPGRADPDSLTLIHTGDLRGHVSSLRYREHATYHGGLLRCASLIEQVRAENPDALLVDCGNALAGSPESKLSLGMLPAEAMRQLRYAVRLLTPGATPSRTREADTFLDGFVPGLSLGDRGDRDPVRAPFRPQPWLIRSVQGRTVGFVGLVAGGAEDTREALGKALEEVRARDVDFLVLILHHRDWRTAGALREGVRSLVYRFPDFDLVLGAGLPVRIEPFSIDGVWYVEADDQGRSLGRVDVQLGNARSDARVTVRRLEAGPEVAEHAGLRRKLGASLGRIEHQLEEVVGYAEQRLEGSSSTPGQSAVQELVSRSVAAKVEAQVVLMGKERGGYLAEGAIQVRDVYRAVPDVDPWVVLALTPRELREVLAENAAFLGSTQFLGIHGATYRLAGGTPDAVAVTDLVLDGEGRPHGRERIRVAVPALLAGSGARSRAAVRRLSSLPEARGEEHAIDSQGAVIEYIRSHQPLRIRPSPGAAVAVETVKGD